MIQGVPSPRGLGWVDLVSECSTILDSAWAEGHFAEVVAQECGKPDHSQPNPGPRAVGTPCTLELICTQRYNLFHVHTCLSPEYYWSIYREWASFG